MTDPAKILAEANAYVTEHLKELATEVANLQIDVLMARGSRLETLSIILGALPINPVRHAEALVTTACVFKVAGMP